MKGKSMEKTYELISKEFGLPDIGYAITIPNFGFCSSPSLEKVEQRSEMFSCRESFGEAVMKHLHRGIYRIPLNRTRLIIFLNSTSFLKESIERARNKLYEDMKIAENVLNILEKRNRWRPTKVYKLISKQNERAIMCMVIGSKNWLRSPHMLSMYCLILRMAKNELFRDIKTHSEFLEACELYVKNGHQAGGYVRDTYNYYDKIMKNFKYLFQDLNMKYNFDPNSYTNHCMFHEGVHKLCSNNTGNPELNKRFKKYCM